MDLVPWFSKRTLWVVAGVWCCLAGAAQAGAPSQHLPSALVMLPFIEVAPDRDTRVEIVNLSGEPQELQCFYVDGSCNELGFFVYLTPYEPATWLASSGTSNESTGTAVLPFFGTGELKCAVMAQQPAVQFHNAIQARATVFGLDGSTVSYDAVGFQRLSDGDFTGVLTLDGTTYAQCPDRLHFDVLTDQETSSSDIVLVPCSENLLLQTSSTVQIQVQTINEFESNFSASISITCADRRTLGSLADTLTRAVSGTDTAHVIIRGVTGPVVGLVIDHVPAAGTAGNEPSFQGGRSATVVFP